MIIRWSLKELLWLQIDEKGGNKERKTTRKVMIVSLFCLKSKIE